jgi:membrane-associated protease RseP (regulator of RpoE activity)
MRFFAVPNETRYDWHFRIGDTPIRVSPWFWPVAVLVGLQDDLFAMLMWVAVCFVSVLIHEFGHMLALRACGQRSRVVLYGFGGLTVPDSPRRQATAALGLSTGQSIMVAAAGPVAGLLTAALTIAIILWAGGEVHFLFGMAGTPRWLALPAGAAQIESRIGIITRVFLPNDLLQMNLYWSLMNLLPVYPLDGGRLAQSIWTARDPQEGGRHAMLLSAIIAALMAIQAVFAQNFYLVVLLGILAVLSIQARDDNARPVGRW